MKKIYTLGLLALGFAANAQIQFDPTISITDYEPATVVMPKSPLRTQVLFVGEADYVQTGVNDSTPAKQWHDFIGFTPDTTNGDLGWVTINHERVQADPKIGDGGGMTSFKVALSGDSLKVVPQTLADGRSGQFFNVDFSTTGETGMNCGGIVSPDGRIWTAEEWWRRDNAHIYDGGAGITDTSDKVLANTGISFADGEIIKAFENLNWMVEIDPKNAVAIRKQYNWGRQPFEGGAIAADNKTVYMGMDNTPGFFSKFVATTAGDFTDGKLYVYRESLVNPWVETTITNMDDAKNYFATAVASKATMFNRIEWFAIDRTTEKVYFTATGRDNPGGRFAPYSAAGCEHSMHTMARAQAQGTHPDSSDYWDYYGRIIEYDPATEEISVFLEGGPYLPVANPQSYPSTALTNPDGLTFMYVNGQSYMVIQEDLNGTSYGRVPAGVSNRLCELYLYDMSDNTPTLADLKKITAVPKGAEVTGARQISENILLVNAQHPSSDNPFPYNNSLTFAIIGWAEAAVDIFEEEGLEGDAFSIYPNPASRQLNFNKTSDVAIYDLNGRLQEVYNQVDMIYVDHLASGVYFVKDGEGNVQRLIVE